MTKKKLKWNELSEGSKEFFGSDRFPAYLFFMHIMLNFPDVVMGKGSYIFIFTSVVWLYTLDNRYSRQLGKRWKFPQYKFKCFCGYKIDLLTLYPFMGVLNLLRVKHHIKRCLPWNVNRMTGDTIHKTSCKIKWPKLYRNAPEHYTEEDKAERLQLQKSAEACH